MNRPSEGIRQKMERGLNGHVVVDEVLREWEAYKSTTERWEEYLSCYICLCMILHVRPLSCKSPCFRIIRLIAQSVAYARWVPTTISRIPLSDSQYVKI